MRIEITRKEHDLAGAVEEAKGDVQHIFDDYNHFELSLASVNVRWERDESVVYIYVFHGGPR